jgi:CARDB
MEKIKNTLKTSTKFAVISLVIIILIFLSFFMVKLIPQILSSVANSTVSISSAFFPSNGQTKNNSATTTNSSNSAVTLNPTIKASGEANNSSNTNSNQSFWSKLFGSNKTDTSKANDSQVNFSVATSSKPNTNDTNGNSVNKVIYNDRNTGNQNAINGKPDLAVQITSIGIMGANGVFVSTNNFTTSDTVVIKFKVENQGTAPSGAWVMRVNMPSSNTSDQIKTISAGSIPAGAAITGQAVFNTPAVGSNQQVTIFVDPNGTIVESNKNNNQTSIALNVTSANNNYNDSYNNGYNYNNNCVNGYTYTNGIYNSCNSGYASNIPNLAIRQIALGKIDAYNQFVQTDYLRTTDNVAIKFEVTNNSSVYTSSWTWKGQSSGPNQYYYNNYSNGNYSNGYTYNNDGSRNSNPTSMESGLAPGETRTYTVTFNNLTYGSNYITVTADSGNNIVESNDNDNVISRSFFVNY